MKRILIILGVVGVFLLVLGGGIFYLLRPGFVPGVLQDIVMKKTGRSLTLAGVPRLSLWPHAAVTLEGVEFSMPNTMEPGVFARAKELRVGVDLRALMARELKVTELTLVGPRINLLIDREGRASWNFEPSGKSEPEGETGKVEGGPEGGGPITDYSIAPINIQNGILAYLDERTGTAIEIRNVNARLKANDRLDGGEITGDLVWNEQKVRFSGAIKSLARLSQGGSPGGLSIDSPSLKFDFDGLIIAGKQPGIAGEVSLSSPDIRAAAHWLGAGLPEGRGLKNVSVAGGIEASGSKFALKNGKLGLDGMTANGDFALAFGSGNPQFSAKLNLDKLDLNTYLPEPQASAGAGADTAGSDQTDEGWSTAPVSFDALRGFTGTLSFATNSLIYRQVTTGPAQLTATLKDGVLDANVSEVKLYGGMASMRVVLDGAGKTPGLKFAFNGSDFDGRALLKDFAGFGRIEGKTSAKLSVATTGSSQAEMASLLKGSAEFRFHDGAVRGINIAQMVRKLGKATLSGWEDQPEQKTDFSELGATFTIADGLAETHDLKLVSPALRVTGAGEVDLLRRALDFKLEPKLVASLEGQGGEGDLTGFPVPIIVKGPWSKPKIYPDVKGILNDPEAAYQTLQKLGIQAKAISQETLDELESQAAEAIGEENTKKLKKKGKKLFKNLLGD
ncbi:MAG: AsmA family protein [Rhizobiales bacterium]|nr:AsmA family protein [Hyphomicrobiales bacterium]